MEFSEDIKDMYANGSTQVAITIKTLRELGY